MTGNVCAMYAAPDGAETYEEPCARCGQDAGDHDRQPCPDCGAATVYKEASGWEHEDPKAPSCFLHQRQVD